MKFQSDFLKTVAGGLGAAILLAITVSGMSFWSANRTLEINHQIAQRLEILNNLESLIGEFKDFEIAHRRYLLTGQKDALVAFNIQLIDVDQAMRRLNILLKNSPSEQIYTERLEALMARNIQQLQQSVELRQTKGLDAAIDRTPVPLLNEAKLLTQQIKALEIVGLRQKQQIATSNALQAMVMFVLGVVLNLAIILGIYQLIRQETLKRNQAQDALKRSEEQFRSFITATSQIIWTADTEGNVNDDMPTWRDFTGQSVAEIAGTGWLNAIHPEDQERTGQAWLEAVKNKSLYEVEYRIRSADGDYRYFIAIGSPVLNQDGSIREWIGTCTDIHDRKLAEIALKQSEERLQAILDNSPAVIYLKDLEGGFITVNRQFEELFHLSKTEIVGKLNSDLFDPELAEIFDENDRQVLETKSAIQLEEQAPHADGLHTYLSLKFPLLAVDGSPYAVCGISTDITDRKRTEIFLAQAKEAAEVANRTKSEFLANMNHELRTPLNGILGYAQILQRDPTTTPKQLKGIGVIHQCGSHLLTLINDILDLSKLEAQKMDLYPQDFHLANFLMVTVEICRIKAEQKGVAFYYHPSPDLPVALYADDKRLRQVLLNLLSNAVKFTDFGSVTFTVEVIEDGIESRAAEIPQSTDTTFTKIRFKVEDTGIGVPPAKLASIFLPFEQAAKRDRNSEGTGLGLAISQQIVQMMGSTIHVESILGKGSTFWFEVNLSAAADWLNQPDVAKHKVIGYQGERRKILVIDDRRENRAVAIGMLEPLGFKMAEADDGQTGLDMALQMRPDLIITDVMMSHMNGLEMTRRLRQLPDFVNLPIIASPASLSQVNMQEVMDAGCNSFFPKPIEFSGLLSELQRYLELQWIYQDAPNLEELPQLTSEPTELVIPSAEELASLYQAARDGFMADIQKEANYLKQLNSLYVPFTNRILELSQQFDDEAILNLIESHI